VSRVRKGVLADHSRQVACDGQVNPTTNLWGELNHCLNRLSGTARASKARVTMYRAQLMYQLLRQYDFLAMTTVTGIRLSSMLKMAHTDSLGHSEAGIPLAVRPVTASFMISQSRRSARRGRTTWTRRRGRRCGLPDGKCLAGCSHYPESPLDMLLPSVQLIHNGTVGSQTALRGLVPPPVNSEGGSQS